jgi:DNA mismatch repair protein MutS
MSATTRPMYKKYSDLWTSHRQTYGPKIALLYQVGGFFELYDTENLTTGTSLCNIREIAELCQLSLTVKPLDESQQTLFGGFPEHSVSKFERILVQAGYTVVVVVQKKGSSGSVEERIVDHIASPGCYTEGERFLVGCVVESLSDGPLQRVYWSVAALQAATGHIAFVEGTGVDRLHQFLCIHPPSELVLWSDGLPAASSLTDSLKGSCGAVHLKCLAPASVALEEAALDRFWSPVRVRLDWMARAPQSRRCLAALLSFANDHMPSALKALALPEIWTPEGDVRLGNAALEQLGLLSLRSSTDNKNLLAFMDHCRSAGGRRLLRSRLMRPVTDVAVLKGRLDAIDATLPLEPVTLERGLRSLYDMSRLWRRLEIGSASLNDMGCLLRSYEAAASLLRLTGTAPELLFYCDWVLSQWSVGATVDLAREGGIPVTGLPWTAGVYPEVEALFASGLAIRTQATTLCKEWSGLGRGETLYLEDAEGGGFRITGTKRRITSVHAALRDEGDLSATVTPYKTTSMLETAGLTALSEKHRAWLRTWIPAWNSAWASSIASLVTAGSEPNGCLVDWCAELDVAWTVSRLAAEWGWTRPVFLMEGAASFDVEGLRHPILERLTTVPYVAHSLRFDAESKGLLLYGMNASGKSSLMKAVGLSVLLAQCGFPVPASKLTLRPFTALFTRILGNDNLWAGLSSFAVEMTEFREILRYADADSLVLGDELCAGTESLSATALVAAGVETLASRGSKFLFATHLHELATLPDIAGLAGVRAAHLKVHYDAVADRLVYDRALAPGSGSALYGLEVCRALDLPVDYLDRAVSLRKALEGWKAPQVSAYSTAVAIVACEVCKGMQGLETHHIRHQAEGSEVGFQMHGPGNLVALCTKCHDDHHGGRLVIEGWSDTSAGRVLVWNRPTEAESEAAAWLREQRRLKIRIPTIQRMAKQLFGLDLTTAQIRAV